jgi:hypothetical protein
MKNIKIIKNIRFYSSSSVNIESIKLTAEQRQELLSGLGEILKDSEQMTVGEYIQNTTSSFDEAFPDYGDETIGILKKFDWEKIKNTFKLDKLIKSEENNIDVQKMLEENGIIKSLEVMRSNPDFIVNSSNWDGNEHLRHCINNLDRYIGNNINPNMIEILNNLEDKYIGNFFESELEIFDKFKGFVELTRKDIEMLHSYKTSLDVGLGVLSFISMTMAYRALIKTYSEGVYGKNDLPKALALKKAKNVREFALFYAPLIIGGLMVVSSTLPSRHVIELGTKTEIDVKTSPSGNVTDKLLLFFTSKNNNKWLKLLKFTILILIIIILVLKYIFGITDYYDLILNAIFSIKNYIFINKFYIKCILVLWIIVWLLYYFLMYIKYKYYYEVEFKNVPKYLPKFIKNVIDELNNHSKEPQFKDFLIKVQFRQAIINLLVCSLYICFLIFI